MSGGPAEVPDVELPGWLGEDFPAEGKLVDKLAGIGAKLADLSAKGADFADFAGNLLNFTGPFDAIGAIGTGLAQMHDSPARSRVARVLDGVIAGFIDLAMGSTPLGPILPAVDSLISSTGVKSPGDIINSGLRAGITAIDGALTGTRQGMETLQARSVVGEYGKVMKGILGG